MAIPPLDAIAPVAGVKKSILLGNRLLAKARSALPQPKRAASRRAARVAASGLSTRKMGAVWSLGKGTERSCTKTYLLISACLPFPAKRPARVSARACKPPGGVGRNLAHRPDDCREGG